MSESKRIMCFGDSLTWGWIPVKGGAPTSRYSFKDRWTGVMASTLGGSFEVIEEGLNGRTTNLDDPADSRLNGSDYLPAALASHFPLDLVVIMLGTNDLKAIYRRSAIDVASGMHTLLCQVQKSHGGVGTTYVAPKVLIIAPPIIEDIPDAWFKTLFAGAQEKSREVIEQYAALANYCCMDFMSSADYIGVDGMDGIHLSSSSNRGLGLTVANKVATLL